MGTDGWRLQVTVAHVETEYDKTMERIVELDLHGLSPTQIAKETGLQRKVVIRELEQVREAWQNNAEARDLARDHLNKLVKHYDYLIKQFYELHEEAETLQLNDRIVGQRAGILKNIAELEHKRVDVLQKAGLLESAEIGDEIAQWEDEKQTMLSILRDLCPACRGKVGARIARLKGEEVSEETDTIDVEVMEQ